MGPDRRRGDRRDPHRDLAAADLRSVRQPLADAIDRRRRHAVGDRQRDRRAHADRAHLTHTGAALATSIRRVPAHGQGGLHGLADERTGLGEPRRPGKRSPRGAGPHRPGRSPRRDDPGDGARLRPDGRSCATANVHGPRSWRRSAPNGSVRTTRSCRSDGNSGAYVLAADFIGLSGPDDDRFRSWLDAIRTRELGGHGRWRTLTRHPRGRTEQLGLIHRSVADRREPVPRRHRRRGPGCPRAARVPGRSHVLVTFPGGRRREELGVRPATTTRR